MEPKRFWVRDYKSIYDVTIDLPTKLTVIIGSSGSGKTALVEAINILRDARLYQATVGTEIWHENCRIVYEVNRDKKFMAANCGTDVSDKIVQEFLSNVIVIKDINWKAIRSLQPVSKEAKLLPDASNVIQYIYTMTGGRFPKTLVEAIRYVYPVKDMWFVDDGNMLVLKLLTENGTTLTQATMPWGVLKTLIVETALMSRPSMIVIDDFECNLDVEAQQFLMDELRSHDVYAILTTHSTVVLDYVKTPKEVVMLRLVNGETKAWRMEEEVEEKLKEHKLTLSELIYSGLLEPL